jgi:hypothetical protein
VPKQTLSPFGSWASPITSDLIVEASISLGDIFIGGADVYRLEGRPLEGGRYVLVQRRPNGSTAEITPPAPFNVRTRVHEYGGGAVVLAGDAIYASNFIDQRLYKIAAGKDPVPLTPAAPGGDPDVGLRHADGLIDSSRNLWIGVREDHRDRNQQAVNTLATRDLTAGGEGTVLVAGTE